jgi:predicted AlkP superfamily phosphohydrolase/phosphomutase
MNSPAKKAIIVGFDGASMELVCQMAEAGHVPHIAKLMASGVYREMLGVLPTLTPPGWTTLATGAWPGTHEVTDFNIRNVGGYIDQPIWGINTDLCQAEFLWNAAERCAKTPILVKYEISWPPTITKGIQVEGTGPGVSNHAQIAGYHLFVTKGYTGYHMGGEKDPESVDPSALQGPDLLDWAELVPAQGWRNMPDSERPPLETDLVIRPLVRGRPNMLRGREGTPKPYHALVYAEGQDGYDRVLVAPEKEASKAFATLAPGQWADWWRDSFTIDDQAVEGSVRCKLMALSPDGGRMELFFPQMWPITGYTYPEAIAQDIYDNVGPFLQNPARDAMGLIDDETYFEVLDYHLDCLADTCLYLMDAHKWDLLFTETHASDYANHFFLRFADPISGAEPAIVERSWQGLVRTYQSMDRMVGSLMTKMDEDTILVLMSDHGGTPHRHGRLEIEEILEQAGLLAYSTMAPLDQPVIDWSQTKAAPLANCNIFINLNGREPEGIVEPEDYERVQQEIIAALFEYRDPATGEHPLALALSRRDAEMVNCWGELVGDVVYALRPEFDGAHGRHLPSSRLGIGAQHALFIMAGAGVKKGLHLQGQVRQVDVAPTISYLLGIDVPRDAEGGIVYEALQDPNWHLTEIRRLAGEV